MVALFTLATWNRLLPKLRESLDKLGEVRYTSVPIWRPWRDF
jgi:hypothetical protein